MSRKLFKSIFRPAAPVPHAEFSPVTSLAHTLDAATIRTPCKRLSLSSLASSDTSCDFDIPLDFDDTIMWEESPDKENRIASPAVCRKRRRNSDTPLRQLQNRPIDYSPSHKCKKAKQDSVKDEFTSPDSRDSGFSESETKLPAMIIAPKQMLPKLDLDSSPTKYSASPAEERQFHTFATLATTLSEDEFITDLISSTPKPANFSNLMSAPFTAETPEPVPRPPIRRCLSMFETTTPNSKTGQSGGPLAVSSPRKDVPTTNPFKRPCSPHACPSFAKRRKPNSDCTLFERLPAAAAVLAARMPVTSASILQRSVSESHLAIMRALNKCDTSEQLTGDFSRSLALPVETCCRHPELRTISPGTLADLLRGLYAQSVESYQVMDCRYPYEYNGGHISGSVNWDSLASASEFFDRVRGQPQIAPVTSRRHVLVFHCEFSAERGPKAQRYLREVDRTAHKEQYPALHFPEMYLLEGGYKAFFAAYPDLCSPQSYTRMLDRNFSDAMKCCRAKSKTFANESKFGMGKCTVSRTSSSKRNFIRSRD